ncbi:glycogen-binding domain-containing protein [Desulfobacter vibrioformis]|uniref:glycogen-binding domain-containing protein n=1 Tax=Desulfobacter vibrioformis TaxID=34031 RepID=UPI00054E438B|nr:glycogen-binding domain-containing protein [Desulfobacter vibrioformis]
MEHLSSMYIDDEMNLQDKQVFITTIREDEQFYRITRDLIKQEQALRSHLSTLGPKPFRSLISKAIRPMGYVLACSFLAVLVYFFSGYSPHIEKPPLVASRFVLYQPGARQVELAGSFNGWKKIALDPIGNSGYWEIRIPLPSGEYRFAYILNGDTQIADPTIPGKELDDFGGVNSILNVGMSI